MLAIRSRSRYKIVLIILIGIITVFSITFVNSYKYIQQISKAYIDISWETGEIQKEQSQELAVQLINSNMALFKEIKSIAAGRILSNSEVFLDIQKIEEVKVKDAEEDYARMLGIITLMDTRASAWTRLFSSNLKEYTRYTVLDDTGKILLKGEGSQFNAQEPIINIWLHYDTAGMMKVDSVQMDIVEHQEITKKTLLQTLEKYHIFNPIEDYRYFYEIEGKYENSQYKIQFIGPKSLKYKYEINISSIYGEESIFKILNDIDSNQYILFFNIILVATIGILMLSFGISFFKEYQRDIVGLSRLPFEIACIIGILEMGFIFSYLPIYIIASTVQGELLNNFISFGILPMVAKVLVILGNILMWLQCFFMLVWAVIAISAMFELGIKKYFIERSLVGMAITWCIHIGKTIYGDIQQVPWGDKAFARIRKLILVQFGILIGLYVLELYNMITLSMYSLIILWFLSKQCMRFKKNYYKLLSKMDAMAKGTLDIDMEEDLEELEEMKQKLSLINKGFRIAVEKELASQKSKSELITNMSHDLKTPLTAIIMYINLLKHEDITEEERKKYLDILDAKSMRFKRLIDDLFEMSMASTGNLKLEISDVDIVGLLKGLRLEYSDKLDESNIDFRWELPDSKIVLQLDAQKTYRIFENLIVNITKYALKHSRAYISIIQEQDNVIIQFKNISEREIYEKPEQLLERFARGDVSRNTSGSGLGLAIAKNLVEAQGGILEVEVVGDVFIASVEFKVNTYFY